MSDFSPSLQNAAAAGIPTTRQPYLDGSAGVRQSLEAMALKMREGRLDPAVIGYARGVLKDAGLDGRDGFPIRRQVSVLLDDLRKRTIYAPDAYGAEVVSSAAATLCLRPGLCLNGEDCDGLAVALGSETLSLGIPTVIVKQNFGGENQEHVLIAFQDENQEWTYADPSTKLPVGRAPQGAVDEIWIDPMGPVGPIPEAGAEIVTLGSPLHTTAERRMHFAGNHWWHQGVGGVSVYDDVDGWVSTNFSEIPSSVGVGTIFGAPTVNEMIDFASVVGAEMKDIGAVPTTCTGWPNNPVGYQAWLMDMQDTMAEFQTASDAALAKFNSTSKYLRDFTTAPEEMSALADVAKQITDLDQRLRAATGGAGCSAPTYADVQQPQATDWDLLGYQGADFTAKVVENAGNKIAGAAQPAAIAFGGLIVGAALAVAGLIVLDHMLPSRR